MAQHELHTAWHVLSSVMSFGQPLPIEQLPTGEAWQEIEAAFEELSRLARGDVGSAELHRCLLERLVGLLAAIGGIVWSADGQGNLALECQLNLAQALLDDREELVRQQRLAFSVAASCLPRMVPAAYRDAELANATPWLAILCPIVVDERTIAVVEIFQRPEGRSSALDGYLHLIRTACEIAEDYHQGQSFRHLKQQQSQLVDFADYLQRIHQQCDLPNTAAAIANEARRVIGCDRVTVLDCLRASPRVVAISGVESFDRKSGIVRALERLARSRLRQSHPQWLPEEADDQPPPVVEQVQALLDESHAAATGLLPLFARAEEERLVGVLAIERFEAAFSPEHKERALLVARASGPALDNAITYDRIPLRGLMQSTAAMLGLAPGQRWSPALVAVVSLAAICLLLWLIPAEFTVEARGQLMPRHRQHVFAPSDGIVVELPGRDGDEVQKGQLLARLHSPTLDIDESELLGKQRTVQEYLIAAETAALRTELEGTSPQPRGQLTARALQLKEELRGLEAQLEIVRQQQATLALRSPLDGIVITWDPERQLAGRPVKRGNSLLTVADTSGPWELVLDVPDHRVGHVLSARRGREPLPVSFQLGTDPGTVGRGLLAFVSPATELSSESQPTVRANVELTDARTTRYRSGATVVARIHCGRRSLGYVWLHEIWEAIRLRLFL